MDTRNAPMDRDRNRRGDRGTRFSDADGNNRDRSREKCPRIYISNIPYETRWQDLKDLFRREVGDVEFVELFADENNKPRGCGIIEFKAPDSVQKALQNMDKYDLNGRNLIVKEDYGNDRDKFGRIVTNNGNRGGASGGMGGGGGGGNRRNDNRDDMRMSVRGMSGGGGGLGGMDSYNSTPMNTYGLSTSFLEGLGIFEPLHCKVFVANLDYKVDEKKLREVFQIAGRIQTLELAIDKDGNSRGFGIIEYDHPVEAVQAISMFDRQMLFERRMTVRLDRDKSSDGFKMPEGLRGIGIGLGPNGEPLRDVARNLPNLQQSLNTTNGNSSLSNMANMNMTNIMGTGNNGTSSMMNQNSNSNLQGLSSNLAALSSVVGLSGSAGLSNPLLSTAAASLNNLGLGLGSNDLQNNQSNNYSSNYGGGSRSDFDLGTSNNSVRNYNTRPSDDYNRGNNGFGSGGNNNNMMGNSGQRTSDTIVIRNLPPSCTWQTLRDKLREVGEVTFAEIRGIDTGVVRFAKERDAELAIKLMDGQRFEGRSVNVTFY